MEFDLFIHCNFLYLHIYLLQYYLSIAILSINYNLINLSIAIWHFYLLQSVSIYCNLIYLTFDLFIYLLQSDLSIYCNLTYLFIAIWFILLFIYLSIYCNLTYLPFLGEGRVYLWAEQTNHQECQGSRPRGRHPHPPRVRERGQETQINALGPNLIFYAMPTQCHASDLLWYNNLMLAIIMC